MNSTCKPIFEPSAALRKDWIVTPSLLATLFLGLSFFALPVMAQQSNVPNVIQSFPAGPNPWGLASDGANIWVTNFDMDTVTKLRRAMAPCKALLERAGGHLRLRSTERICG